MNLSSTEYAILFDDIDRRWNSFISHDHPRQLEWMNYSHIITQDDIQIIFMCYCMLVWTTPSGSSSVPKFHSSFEPFRFCACDSCMQNCYTVNKNQLPTGSKILIQSTESVLLAFSLHTQEEKAVFHCHCVFQTLCSVNNNSIQFNSIQ